MNRTMKQVVLFTVVFLCITGLVFAGGSKESQKAGKEKITIAYTGFPGGLTPFWAQMAKYMQEEADALGVKLVDLSPTTADANLQKQSVDNAIDMGVQGIIIGSIDNRALMSVLLLKRIIWLLHDSWVNTSLTTLHKKVRY